MSGLLTVMYGIGAYAVFFSSMERDLTGLFGDRYRRYRERVSMLIPPPGGHQPDERSVAGPRSARR